MAGISKLCSIANKEELHALVDDMFNQFSERRIKNVLSMRRASDIVYAINWSYSKREWSYYTRLYSKIQSNE